VVLRARDPSRRIKLDDDAEESVQHPTRMRPRDVKMSGAQRWKCRPATLPIKDSRLGNAFRELPDHAQVQCAGATEVSTYVSVSLGG
jgi:hypothetical protein